MPLKPWHTVVTPREDLRDGRPLDASGLAVHLDHVRDGRAPAVYQEPARKWTTFYTRGLSRFAREAGLELRLEAIFEVQRDLQPHKLEETRAALRELGLSDDVHSE